VYGFHLYEGQEQTIVICDDGNHNTGCLWVGAVQTMEVHEKTLQADENVLIWVVSRKYDYIQINQPHT
jgi:hypothetical protein